MRHAFLVLPCCGLLCLPCLSSCLSSCRDEGGAPSVAIRPAATSSVGSEASRDGAAATPGERAPATDAAAADDEPMGAPSVQYVGRFDVRDPAGPICAWPGCRIVARFDGSRVSARFTERTANWMLGGPSEWDVAIDGVWGPKLVMPTDGDPRTFVLAESLAPGVHSVELYKRSEAQNGVTQFHGYDFGEGTLLPPPRRRARRIEIIGDSAPAAYGVEGVGQGPDCPGLDYAAMWQNFRRSLGARLGERLDAEVTGTVYSGKGMAKNIWHPDKETMPVLFPRTLPNDRSSAWDVSLFVADVVVIMIGGNDFAIGQPVDEGPATLADFVDAYDGFVMTLRQTYPHAHVLLVTSPSVSDLEPPNRATRTNVMAGIRHVVDRRNAAGDTRVHGVTPPVALKTELTGCDGHGSPELHERVADDLVSVVRAATGW